MPRTGWPDAVAHGVRQYVVLGAGLDTFAYRNPFTELRVFEVDFPATQEWKREMLAEALIPLPASLTFVPLDFEHKILGDGLDEAGFDTGAPAFFGWLGVVPYLTLNAFRATLNMIACLPAGSGVTFDYGFSAADAEPGSGGWCLRCWPNGLPLRVSRSVCSSSQMNWSGSCAAPDFIAWSRWMWMG